MRAEIPRTAGFSDRYFKTGWGADYEPCQICGRKVKDDAPVRYSLYVDHTSAGIMVTPDEAEDDEDISMYAVGPDCYRKHPEIHPFCSVTKQEDR